MSDERLESDRPDSSDLACELSDEAQIERREQLATTVFEEIEDIEEHETGYAFTLPGTTEALEAVLAFIATERECCPFLRFELDVAPDNGPITLRLSGPDGVKDLIKHALHSEQLESTLANQPDFD